MPPPKRFAKCRRPAIWSFDDALLRNKPLVKSKNQTRGARPQGKPEGRSARFGVKPKPRAEEPVRRALPVTESNDRPARKRDEKWDKASSSVQVFMAARHGDRPREVTPVILETAGDAGYRLLDTGAGLKLEQYGDLRVVRPEAQALWPKALPESEWEKADAIFSADADDESAGRWRVPKRGLGETWPLRRLDVAFLGSVTP